MKKKTISLLHTLLAVVGVAGIQSNLMAGIHTVPPSSSLYDVFNDAFNNSNDPSHTFYLQAGQTYNLFGGAWISTLSVPANKKAIFRSYNGAANPKIRMSGEDGSIFYLSSGASLDLHNMTVEGDSATRSSWGGRAFNSNGGHIKLYYCQILNCRSNNHGGGAYLSGGSIYAYDTLFSKCSAGSTGGAGGAICSFGGSVSGFASDFFGCTAGGSGGAIYSSGNISLQGSHTQPLYESSLNGNTASDGGAIFVGLSASCTLLNVEVSSNTAQNLGGGIFVATNASLSHPGTIFSNNSPQDIFFN